MDGFGSVGFLRVVEVVVTQGRLLYLSMACQPVAQQDKPMTLLVFFDGMRLSHVT